MEVDQGGTAILAVFTEAEIMNWLRRLFLRRGMYGDLTDEIRAHLDEKVEELVANGVPREEALHAARREFGNVLLIEERGREVWRWTRVENFLTDARYALRGLRKSPGFTVVAILTLALGIGANTAIFSMVNGILLRALPYQQPRQLYEIYETIRFGSQVYSSEPVNGGNFLAWQRECRSFAGIALLMPVNGNLDLGSGAVQVHGAEATAGLLPTLGVQPALGRNFLPEEDQTGHDKVVILTHTFWRTYFHSDPAILGMTIRLNGYPFVVVGVLPPDFYIPKGEQLYATPEAGLQASIDYFTPLSLGPRQRMPGLAMHNYAAIARLRAGVSREQALADIDAVQARILRQITQAAGTTLSAELVPLKTAVTGSAATGLWALLAGAAAVLLIVCVNLAGLLLTRSLGRQHEMAVRVALGASGWNLLRQFLAEGLILALAGGGLGLLLAHYGLQALVRSAPVNIPRVESISIDARVLLFTAGISLLAGLLFSVLPALRLSRTPPGEALKSASRAASGARKTMRLRNALAISEIALCGVLLATAFLLAESLGRVLQANAWLAAERVVTLQMILPPSQFPNPAQRHAFFGRLIRKAESLPGVDAAGTVSALPLQGEMWTDGVEFQEAPQPAGSVPNANFRFASPGYFRAVGLPLIRGRYFAPSDEGRPVVMLSESVARKVLPGRNPIGMHLRWSSPETNKPLLCEVTGVVGDARTLADQSPPLMVYLPDWIWSRLEASLVVRSAADPHTTAGEMREIVRSLDPQIAIPQEETMSELVGRAVAPRRFVAFLGVLFAVFAAFLAMLGLYGVISLSVAQRAQELGIRIALGAQPGNLLRLVLGQGTRLALLGVAIGIGGGLGTARLLKSLLYGVEPTDPVTFLTVAVLLTGVALLACYVPARRAAKVDPITALRNE
jgi:predicted permease